MKINFLSPILWVSLLSVLSTKGQTTLDKELLKMRQVPDIKPNVSQNANTPHIFNKTIITTGIKPGGGSSPQSITDNNDIRIFPTADVQAEVHISINRANPNIILASANTYTTTYNQGYYYSSDGGTTWNGADALQNNAGTVEGDPSTAIGSNGRMYISSINPGGGYYLQNSTNNGQTVSLTTGAGTETGFDKEMIAVDDQAGSPFANNLYCAWTNFAAKAKHLKKRTS